MRPPSPLLTIGLLALLIPTLSWTQAKENHFLPFTHEWPAPNDYRTAAGAPGPEYWQQKADYKIQVSLDEAKRTLSGSEVITYSNQSPHTLSYLWIQLDQNRWSRHSISQNNSSAGKLTRGITAERLQNMQEPFEGGLNLEAVTDVRGKEIPHQIVETNVRLDLPEPLLPGKSTQIQLRWNYRITDAKATGDRAGFEYFEEDDNCIFEIAQFYPRMCTYTHDKGWQNQPYINTGEFSLEFGDFEVEITVPEDHIVTATGELQNSQEVLSQAQLERLKTTTDQEEKVGFIVTPAEARTNQMSKSTGTKTWKF